MKKRDTNPTRVKRAPARQSLLDDPVAAFWLNMSRTARTEGLRLLHAHLACQRADFLEYRLKLEQERATA